jgi:hypothetical protein
MASSEKKVVNYECVYMVKLYDFLIQIMPIWTHMKNLDF